MVVGGMGGCGGCMVMGGAWLWGVVAGGVHGCRGRHVWLQGEVCMVAGVMCGCIGGMLGCGGFACVVAEGTCMGYDEIQSMTGRHTSYWYENVTYK